MIYGVSESGFKLKPRSVILQELKSKYKSIFGDQFDTSDESPDGQKIGIEADLLAEAWLLAEFAYNSYKPEASSGIILDNLVSINNIKRIRDRPSTVAIYPKGVDGTIIPKGSLVKSASGKFFKTLKDTTIPNVVDAECTELGEIPVPQYSVNTIVTMIDGWDEVTNNEEGITGIIYESDPQLRARRERSIIITGSDTTEAIYSALNRLNLDYITIVENSTNAEVDGVPPHSFHVVCTGGTPSAIASAIRSKKPLGIQAYGDIVVDVEDSQGYTHKVGFSRPEEVLVYLDLKIYKKAGASNDTQANIHKALVDYINNINIGVDVEWSYIIPPILSAESRVKVDTLLLGTDLGAMSREDIAIRSTQKAVATMDSVVVTIL